MRRLGGIAFLPLLAAFAVQAGQTVVSTVSDSEIDRLVELMRIRELLAQGAEQALAMPELASASEERKTCMRRLSIGDIALESPKRRIRAAFPDADSRQRAITFFSTDAGRKVVEWMLKPGAGLAEIKASMGPNDYEVFVDYVRSGGGEALRVLNTKGAKDDSVTRAIQQECPRR